MMSEIFDRSRGLRWGALGDDAGKNSAQIWRALSSRLRSIYFSSWNFVDGSSMVVKVVMEG